VTLASGSRLGPYEIVSPLGAGGMGEVYRAKDPRLGRDVAIKVLPASFATDADRLRRFEQEARAAGLLNHPNITAVYDIGSHDGAPYVVSELLEGETLRSRLAPGPLPTRKALDYAVQIARGLAAAHEKGIVHRDLKPENLFVTKDGRVKILDFGLAKLKQPESGGGPETELPTGSLGTEPGVVMGTMGYMAPEQVRGRAADSRSDIFSFGAILYEMLSGRRAFQGDTAADTITAILTKEPPDLSSTNKDVHPGLDRIVHHSLEKNPEERFQSASDLAFDLEALSGISTPSAALPGAAVPVERRRRSVPVLAAAAALIVGAAAGSFLGRRLGERPAPRFQQLTYRHGEVTSARFAPDGLTIVYAAAWDGKPIEIFQARREGPESRPFGLPGADVLSISRSGEMAVSLNRRTANPFTRTGMLAQVGVSGGGAPREIADQVQFADWAPDGKKLAVVRDVGGQTRLEYPVGTKIYETAGWIGNPRVSPKGDGVAFIDHAIVGDDGGSIAFVDATGRKNTVSEFFGTAQGVAWRGDEILFTAAEYGNSRGVYATTRSGRVRLLARVTGNLTIQDVAKDGAILLSHDVYRSGIRAAGSGDGTERELGWLDWSIVSGISADGKTVLFTEAGEGGGDGYSFYTRNIDGSPAVRLGEGSGQMFSPDGKTALAILHPASDPQLMLLPVGAGERRLLPKENIRISAAAFLPDGRIIFSGAEPKRPGRIYVRDASGSPSRPVVPEGYRGPVKVVSPDGRFVPVRAPDRKTYLAPIAGGSLEPLPTVAPDERLVAWTDDGRLMISDRNVPAKISLLDIKTGERQVWKTIIPADPAGLVDIAPVFITPDRKTYAYTYSRILSDLYLVEGLK
jgi:eukaryotic-like serine/threonine-protein kinase